VRNPEVAENLTQDCFIRAYKARDLSRRLQRLEDGKPVPVLATVEINFRLL
jgi:hypothetical protein